MIALPNGSRCLKVININSAMNGLLFERKGEYKQQREPQSDDINIEVMATRGVHHMCQIYSTDSLGEKSTAT